MDANDARIARLYTAQAGGLVEDNTPNANSPTPNQLDLILQAEAGGVLGNSGANYTLTFTAINDDTAAPEPNLNPVGNPFKEQFNAGDGWKKSGNDFVKTSAGEPDGIGVRRGDRQSRTPNPFPDGRPAASQSSSSFRFEHRICGKRFEEQVRRSTSCQRSHCWFTSESRTFGHFATARS